MADDASGELIQAEEIEPPVLPQTAQILDLDAELTKITNRVMIVKLLAQAYCKVHGPAGGCFCKGRDSNCHAATIYEMEARAAVTALERFGILKR